MVPAVLWLFSWLRAILMRTLAWDCKHIHAELQSKCWPLSQLLVHGWAWTDGKFPTCRHWARWIGGSISDSDMHVMIMTHWLGLLHGLDKSFVIWSSSCTLLQFTDEGYVWLVYKPLVMICTTDLLGEKNTVLWLISRLIMAAEQSPQSTVYMILLEYKLNMRLFKGQTKELMPRH